MVTSREDVSDEIASDKLQQREKPGFPESEDNKKGSPLSTLPEKASSKLQQRQSTDTGPHASLSNPEGSTLSLIPEKVSKNLQQRQSPDNVIHASQSNQERSTPSTIPEKESDDLQQTKRPDTGIYASECNREGSTLSIIPEKVSDILQQRQDRGTGVHASQSDQEKFSLSIIPHKVLDKLPLRRNPVTGIHALRSDKKGSTPTRTPDKASEDGYNWRKYGQKLVKGNEFVRSYYKCTYPNCPAKKQVERSHDGPITDINYRSKHDHPKPKPIPHITTGFILPIQAKRPDKPSLTIAENESSNAHGDTSHHIDPTETPQLSTVAACDDAVEGAVSQSNITSVEVDNDGDPDLKRQKRDISNVDDTLMDKPNGEPRVVVQTMSEADIVNDGYRWRKYGQKLVKGNPNPRSYYRCSNAGCPVKKHVERASHDPKVVITTYEGQHDHDIPPSRTVTHNTAGAKTNTTLLNGESRSKLEENKAVGLEMVVHISAN